MKSQSITSTLLVLIGLVLALTASTQVAETASVHLIMFIERMMAFFKVLVYPLLVAALLKYLFTPS